MRSQQNNLGLSCRNMQCQQICIISTGVYGWAIVRVTICNACGFNKFCTAKLKSIAIEMIESLRI